MTSQLHKRWFRVEETNNILRVAFAAPEVAEEPDCEAAAMNVRELLDRCARDEGEAWAELWLLVEPSARAPLRGLLQSWHEDATPADDAMQEFYLYLTEQKLRRLRGFDGDSVEEFHAF